MQHIGLRLESERGEVIEKSEVNFGDIINALDSEKKDKYPWLFGVDPYGFTFFNLHQVPNVINELKSLESEADENLKSVINKTVEFLQKVKQHTYIRLIGD